MAKNKKTLDELLQEAIVKDAPYEVPGNWVWSKLNPGFAECLDKFRKPINASERASRQGNIPYYGATGQVGWINDFLIEDELVLIGEDGAPFFDVLKNKAYIIHGKSWVNNHAHILKSKFDSIGNKYLMHYLNIFNYTNYVNGTTRLKLTQKSMNDIPIPIPPLKEQERIVEKIECLFDKLDKAKELIEEVREDFEKRKASILEKAFRGELTEKWREENSTVNQSNMNKNLPYNWKMSKLMDTCEIIMGQSPKSQSYNDEGKGVPLINGPVEFGNSHFSKTIKSKWTTEPTKICLKNDLLLCVRGSTLGRINIAGFDACIGRGVAAIRSKMYQKYINYKIHSIRNKIYSIGTGTTFPNISRKQIGELDIEFPPLEEQKEIVRILDKLLDEENKIEKLTNLENQIELTKKSILAKAFRGELGTNDPSEESAMELLKEVLQEKL
ncbi:hypothetical protein AXF41_11495 [Clostridium haemolyticum]|uniref:restriction endonuclease subunit S n=1 Tax=Clostridium haemolyticum TaxID=84025 RepID=UPI0009D374B0|nr:restriction endonuclease subunit S [Clostridium haemolyticum]OOB76577.1 hypothetical protein AXF41_11495 [Clostridium haemolyticum]